MAHSSKLKVRRKTPGTNRLELTLEPNTDFDTIVNVLKQTLVVPELPGIRGCAPCLSGLDRLVLESTVIDQLG